jgi:large subunit ribosomal protein L32e
MAALQPLVKPKIIKKKTKKLIRLQSDQYVKIKGKWWQPRGMEYTPTGYGGDSRARS